MIKNYFKIAWRNLIKSKSFSFLNILGLSVGMACSILILLWVQNEVSYDTFHKDSDRTYRLIVNSSDFYTAVSSAGMPVHLADELPEIESMVRITKFENVFFDINNTVHEEEHFMYVDSNFLSFFDFPLLSGNKNTALTAPNTIVLTESIAQKYFGNQEALGRTLKLNNQTNVVVSGVLKGLPPNSHFKFNIISSVASIAESNPDFKERRWGNFNYYSYLKINKNVNSSETGITDLASKINDIGHKHMDNTVFNYRLQPLEDIHLYSDLQLDVAGHGNVQYVNIFFIIALFILVVACINFMNLATARSAKRSKEVGLRKAIGAERVQLISQFLSESILISLVSLLVAIAIVFLTLPHFNEIAGKTLSIDVSDANFWLSLFAVVLVTGLFSGSYPALYLSGFSPVKVLRGSKKMSGGNLLFRNSLVVTQFIVSAVLIVGTAVIYNQLSFIKNKNLGFDKSNIVIVPFHGEIRDKQEALLAALQQNPLLENHSIFNELPTNLSTGTTNIIWDGKDENDGLVVPNMKMDANFIKLFDVEILAGRGFSDDFAESNQNFIVNETLMKLMGHDKNTIIGQKLSWNEADGIVVGLVKDFHFKPLQYDIEPLVLREQKYGKYLAIKTTLNQTQNTISALEDIHANLNPAFPFTYSFLDADLEHLYDGEQQMGQIFNIFAILAIFISCLGIYGLSAFMAEQRTKEIGIRKVLGASTAGLVNLMSKDFVKLVFIALVIAVPLSWYYLNQWLSDFAYHISISWWMYALAGILVLGITLLTVSYQGVKTALLNPVDSLKSE